MLDMCPDAESELVERSWSSDDLEIGFAYMHMRMGMSSRACMHACMHARAHAHVHVGVHVRRVATRKCGANPQMCDMIGCLGNIEFLTDLRRNSDRGFTLVSAAHSKYSQSVTCWLRNTSNRHFFSMTVCSGWGLCVHAWHVRRACTLPTTLDPHTASEAKLAKWNDGLKLAHRGVHSQPPIACKCMPDRKCLTHVQHLSQVIPGHLAHFGSAMPVFLACPVLCRADAKAPRQEAEEGSFQGARARALHALALRLLSRTCSPREMHGCSCLRWHNRGQLRIWRNQRLNCP